MSNSGLPLAIAESVENTLPETREPTELHKHPNDYPLRNHLLMFFVTRSRELAGAEEEC